MKNSFSSIRDKIVKRYTQENEYSDNTKSTNINILLKVKLDQKKKVEIKYYLQPQHHFAFLYSVF